MICLHFKIRDGYKMHTRPELPSTSFVYIRGPVLKHRFNTGFVTIEAVLVDLWLKIHKLNINPYSSGHMNNSVADIMSINGYNFKHSCKILKGLLVLNNNFQASFQPK